MSVEEDSHPQEDFTPNLNELSSHSANEETISESSPDYLLKLPGKGLCGFLERIPMYVKLILMSIISVLGIIALGVFLIVVESANVKQSIATTQFLDNVDELGNLVAVLQKEIAAGATFVGAHKIFVLRAPYISTFANTDKAFAVVKELFPTLLSYASISQLYSLTSDNIQMMNLYYTEITTLRLQALSTNYTDIISFGVTYQNLIYETLSAMDLMGKNTGADDSLSTTYITTTRLTNTIGNLFVYGSLGLYNPYGFQSTIYSSFVTTAAQVSAFQKDLLTVAPVQFLFYFNGLMENSSAVATSLSFLDIIINNPLSAQKIINVNDYFGNLTVWIGLIENSQSWQLTYWTNVNTDMYLSAAGAITAAVILSVVFFAFSAIYSILFSQSIIGPWSRLNRTQEMTIKKFVPTSLLFMIKCKTVAEVVIGKHTFRKATLVRVRIRGHSIIETDAHPVIAVNRLNKLFEHLGPIVRKNGGFIETFLGDGFVSIFNNEKNGFNACISMQQAMQKFNLTPSNAEMSVLIVAHSARVIACALGENERVNGAFVSDHITMLNEVVRIGMTFDQCKVIVTNPIVQALKKEIQYRYLGLVSMTNDSTYPSLQIYEILDETELAKIEAKKSFSEGLKLIDEGNFIDAFSKLEDCCKDNIAMVKLAECKRRVNMARRISENWTLMDTLNEPNIILPAFREHCRIERNEENVNLWIEIEHFRSLCDIKERQEEVKRVMARYFDNINVSIDLRRSITLKLEDEKVEIGVNFFRELQNELEVIMKDAHKRFCESPNLINSLCKLIL